MKFVPELEFQNMITLPINLANWTANKAIHRIILKMF